MWKEKIVQERVMIPDHPWVMAEQVSSEISCITFNFYICNFFLEYMWCYISFFFTQMQCDMEHHEYNKKNNNPYSRFSWQIHEKHQM